MVGGRKTRNWVSYQKDHNQWSAVRIYSNQSTRPCIGVVDALSVIVEFSQRFVCSSRAVVPGLSLSSGPVPDPATAGQPGSSSQSRAATSTRQSSHTPQEHEGFIQERQTCVYNPHPDNNIIHMHWTRKMLSALLHSRPADFPWLWQV